MNTQTTNQRLDELAARYDNGEFTDAQYLAEITKIMSGTK